MTAGRWSRVAFALAASALLAAAATTDDYVARMQEERARTDRELRSSEVTPFTAVDVRMLRVDEETTLGACGGEPRFDPPAGCRPRVTLRYTADGFQRLRPDGVANPVGDRLDLGRFRLSLSRQEDRGRILVHDPRAPAQRAFRALRWYPVDPGYRVAVTLEPFDDVRDVRMATTAGLFKTLRRYGRVRFQLGGAEQRLAIYLFPGEDPQDPAAFFIPFRDATAGTETYAVGRYVHLEEGEGGAWFLDFNRADNPNCAYNPHWNCPIPPAENVLSVAVRAGELPYGDDH